MRTLRRGCPSVRCPSALLQRLVHDNSLCSWFSQGRDKCSAMNVQKITKIRCMLNESAGVRLLPLYSGTGLSR